MPVSKAHIEHKRTLVFDKKCFQCRRIKVITGRKFGFLLVLGCAGYRGRKLMWWCKCLRCGTIKQIAGNKLHSGNTVSCRCWMRDVGRLTKTHGQTETMEYRSYCAAKARCNRPTSTQYRWYGARGIEFKFDSFEAFYAEVGPRPSLAYTLDRIDNNGHYEAGNVRWATAKECQRTAKLRNEG